jgi:hypothetical protein
LDKQLPAQHSFRGVEIKDFDGGFADFRFGTNFSRLHFKMICPKICSGIVKRDRRAFILEDSGKITAFIAVTS